MGGGELSFDVVVVGGGAAGSVAAIAARSFGKSVACVARATGGTVMSSGAVDFRPDARTPYDIHEYDDVFNFARAAFPGLGLSAAAPDGLQFILPTAFGTWKRVLMGLSTQVAADLRKVQSGGEILVVRFFDVEDAGWWPTGFLERHAADKFGISGFSVRELELQLVSSGAMMNGYEAASLLDTDHSLVVGLAHRISQEVVGGRTSLVLLEPVMGITSFRNNMQELSAATGVPCAEMLSPAPSVPGLRWKDAMESALVRDGVVTINSDVAGYLTDERRVASLHFDDGLVVKARSFVLATGKFIGGGIRRGDEGFRESIFGLPARCPGSAQYPYIGDLMGRDIREDHAAMMAGLTVDGRLCPQGVDGAPVYDNLFAAGAVIGQAKQYVGISGLGMAIISGYHAGINASQVV
jgi:glycerol-3-phosphate dehydrogenase subunit B